MAWSDSTGDRIDCDDCDDTSRVEACGRDDSLTGAFFWF